MSDNPNGNTSTSEMESDHRLERRALDPEEQRKLLSATQASERTSFGLMGPERALLYRLALTSGLRANELGTLAPLAFAFGTSPTVTVEARNANNRNRETLPLLPEVAERLRAYVGIRPADAPVWPGRWSKHATTMLREDLAGAGIPFEVDGRRADFHSLRATFCTSLADAGVSLVLARRLMRHCDVSLTGGK